MIIVFVYIMSLFATICILGNVKCKSDFIQKKSMLKEVPYFENVPKIGNLFFVKSYYEFEHEPIVFICENEHEHEFLCYCSEIRKKQKWIIVKILKAITKGNIDVRSAILSARVAVIITMDVNGKSSVKTIATKYLFEEDLPKGKETVFFWHTGK